MTISTNMDGTTSLTNLGRLLREQLAFQEQPKVNKKLDTTGLTGKDRILMLAEIIKAAEEQGRELQFRAFPRPSRIGTVHDVWHSVPPNGATYTEKLNWRIKPIIKTYYVNLYGPADLGVTPGSDENWWTRYETAEAARQGAFPYGAFAVAVPITVEE